MRFQFSVTEISEMLLESESPGSDGRKATRSISVCVCSSIIPWHVANIQRCQPYTLNKSISVHGLEILSLSSIPNPKIPLNKRTSWDQNLKEIHPNAAVWWTQARIKPYLVTLWSCERETDGVNCTGTWVYVRSAPAGGPFGRSGTCLVHTLQRRLCVGGYQQISYFQCMRESSSLSFIIWFSVSCAWLVLFSSVLLARKCKWAEPTSLDWVELCLEHRLTLSSSWASPLA